MNQKDRLYFPKPEQLLEEIRLFSQSDDWGGRVLALEHALRPYERRGSVTGFRPWLLASEKSRQRVLWDSVLDLTGSPHSDIRVRRALDWLGSWPHKAASRVSWKTMLQTTTGNSTTLIAGSFRKIPTPTQIEFVRQAVLHGERAERNVLVLDPPQNIAVYKPNASVFPYRLRAAMWAVVPLLDLIVRNKDFNDNDPLASWQQAHTDLRKRARVYTPVIESYQKDTLHQIHSVGWNHRAREFSVWEDDPKKPAYLGYGTTTWESACTGERKFVDMAMKFLVTEQG